MQLCACLTLGLVSRAGSFDTGQEKLTIAVAL